MAWRLQSTRRAWMETAPRMPLKRAAASEIQSAKGMVHMGGRASVRVSLWLFPLFPFCRTTPPSNQVEPGKTLPSVKLKNPNLPGFGTVPLRFALFSHDRSLPPASQATDHSSLATRHPCGMRNGEFGMRNEHQSNSFPIPHSAFRIRATRHYSEPLLFVPSGVNPADLRTVRLFPARPIRLFCTACWTVRSSGSVSVCERTHTARRLAA